MKKQNKILLAVIIIFLILIILVFGLPLFSNSDQHDISVTTNPLLWEIEGDKPSYLYGSIHLAKEEVLTLPDVVMDKLNEVDAVYTEIKLDEETQMYVLQMSILSDGQTLDDLLPSDVLNRLHMFLNSKGYPSSTFSNYKIWMVNSYLALLDNLDDYMIRPELDAYIWNLAVSKGKNTGGIETADEQINIFDDLSIEEQIQLLNDTLDSLESYQQIGINPIDVMLDAYLQGDLKLIQDLMLTDYDENDSFDLKMKNSLIINRNYNMSERISQLINDNPDEQFFFTIGAGHFYGDEGIINLLEKEGFNVERVLFRECNNCDSGEISIDGRCYYPYEK